jgi:hypothetical protein
VATRGTAKRTTAVDARQSVSLRGQGTTSNGLRLSEGLTFEAWIGVGKQLSRMSRASAWWLGDWIVYGERTYGQRYKTALELTSLDYQTLRNYAWVARSFPLSRRRDKLSFQHHAEVASLSEAEQDLWLQRAERLEWTRAELRRNLAAVRRRELLPVTPPSIVLRMEVSSDREHRWREAAEATHLELEDWIATVADQAAAVALVS